MPVEPSPAPKPMGAAASPTPVAKLRPLAGALPVFHKSAEEGVFGWSVSVGVAEEEIRAGTGSDAEELDATLFSAGLCVAAGEFR